MTGQGPPPRYQPRGPQPQYPQPPGPGWWMASDGRWYPPSATPAHPAPPATGNGMGVAAMVLGIIGVACGLMWPLAALGIILGVLALIFGAVARGRTTRYGATGGQALAGVILGVVAIGLAGYGLWMQSRVVDGLSHIFDHQTVEADATANRMTIARCHTVDGAPTADGTLLNTGSRTTSFRVHVGFNDQNGVVQTADVLVSDVPPHSTASWTARAYQSLPTMTGCAFIRDPAVLDPGGITSVTTVPAEPVG